MKNYKEQSFPYQLGKIIFPRLMIPLDQIYSIFKQMGNWCFDADKQEIIKVCTLNYCGISYSPFEFYFKEHQKDLQKISQIFKRLVAQYVSNFNDKFKWEMGKIEKSFKLGRYSNMFEKNKGIENYQFINRNRFQKLWYSAYNQYLSKGNLKAEGKEQQAQVCLYDFIMYHTLLIFVYGDQPFQQLIKNKPAKFSQVLDPFYKISFLNEQVKLNKFKAGIQTHLPHVLFIQEYSSVLLQYIKKSGYFEITTDPGQDSFIALSNKVFTKDLDCDQIVNQLRKAHTFFETTAITVANRIIFISVHLSSSQTKNKEQVIFLKEGIKVLEDNFKDHNFVIAGDLNSFVKFEKNIFFYPETEEQYTTLKKRTASQSQFHKAEKENKQSKDKIICSLPLSKGRITLINDQPAHDKISYIPNNDHPHDHYLIQTQISLRYK